MKWHCTPQLRLKDEASILLCFQLCSTCYTAAQISDYLKRNPTIKEATMKIIDEECIVCTAGTPQDEMMSKGKAFNLSHCCLNEGIRWFSQSV